MAYFFVTSDQLMAMDCPGERTIENLLEHLKKSNPSLYEKYRVTTINATSEDRGLYLYDGKE